LQGTIPMRCLPDFRSAIRCASQLALALALSGAAPCLRAQGRLATSGFDLPFPAGTSVAGAWDGSGWRAGGVPGGSPSNVITLFAGASGNAGGRSFAMGGAGMGTVGGQGLMNSRGRVPRLDSSISAIRLSYRDRLSAHRAGQFGDPDGGPSYSSSYFGNGMFNVSATATYGGRQVTGSFGAGATRMLSGPGGEKHSAPAVALKLSF